MRSLAACLFLAGAIALNSLNAFSQEYKVGDKMPEPRGNTVNYSLIMDMADSNLKGVITVNYDSGDRELYLKCRDEEVDISIIKRPPFGIYVPDGNGGKTYFLDADSDSRINSIFKMDVDDFRKELDDASSCEGKI
ncbi:MAG: hypothetical protein AABY03_02245 [Nanoarchaeota archaeon]